MYRASTGIAWRDVGGEGGIGREGGGEKEGGGRERNGEEGEEEGMGGRESCRGDLRINFEKVEKWRGEGWGEGERRGRGEGGEVHKCTIGFLFLNCKVTRGGAA